MNRNFKAVVWKYFGSLITDNGGSVIKISLGRLFLTTLLVIAILIWTGVIPDSDRELPSTMLAVIMALLGYVLGSKGVQVYKGLKQSVNSKPQSEMTRRETIYARNPAYYSEVDPGPAK